ncbi:MAG: hypothetical protein R3F11_05550 [Verrucomicrobiales bacterium]
MEERILSLIPREIGLDFLNKIACLPSCQMFKYQPSLSDYSVVAIRRHIVSLRSGAALFIFNVSIYFFVPRDVLAVVGPLESYAFANLVALAAILLITGFSTIHWRTNPNLNCSGVAVGEGEAIFDGEAAERRYPSEEVRTRELLGRTLFETPDGFIYPVPTDLLRTERNDQMATPCPVD